MWGIGGDVRVSCFMRPESHANRTKHAIELATVTEFTPASDRSRNTTYSTWYVCRVAEQYQQLQINESHRGFPFWTLGSQLRAPGDCWPCYVLESRGGHKCKSKQNYLSLTNHGVSNSTLRRFECGVIDGIGWRMTIKNVNNRHWTLKKRYSMSTSSICAMDINLIKL